jgi:hypothetical protein
MGTLKNAGLIEIGNEISVVLDSKIRNKAIYRGTLSTYVLDRQIYLRLQINCQVKIKN